MPTLYQQGGERQGKCVTSTIGAREQVAMYFYEREINNEKKYLLE